MDIVYVVAPEEENESLRYSLRSLVHFPHDRVFIVGDAPDWVQNVVFIKGNHFSERKYLNSTNNLLLAAKNKSLSDDFSYWNDDMYAIAEVADVNEIPVVHLGNIMGIITRYKSKSRTKYYKGMVSTYAFLKNLGIDPIFSYEAHTPMTLNKEKFLEVIAFQRQKAPEIEAIHKRTLYGNFYKIGGEAIVDPKIALSYTNDLSRIHGGLFGSSNDESFRGFFGDYLRYRFPKKSIYEK